jgi:hypothetical protein
LIERQEKEKPAGGCRKKNTAGRMIYMSGSRFLEA